MSRFPIYQVPSNFQIPPLKNPIIVRQAPLTSVKPAAPTKNLPSILDSIFSNLEVTAPKKIVVDKPAETMDMISWLEFLEK